jgi:CPA2 family monovalent cation:H+ antiporter-2
MGSLDFLRDLLIVFAVAGAVVFLFHRLRLPAVVGLLVAGVLAGPYGLSLIHEVERVETLAEVGVVVLLFAVGLEFSLPRLAGLGRLMARVGAPQVLACVLAGVLATAWYFGDVRPALFVGMLLAMSSTAVVFKLLTDRGELTSPQGNVAAAVLLLQDLLVVVCMVVLPLLAARGEGDPAPAWSLGLGAGVVVLLLLAGRFVVPLVLFQVVRTHNRELFLMVLVLLCLGSSALTAAMGWSLALGAFLAGLALSESEYATQTLAEVLPFRDTLASLFFVSVGMLLDLRFLAAHLPLVALTVAAVVALKFAAGLLPTLLAGYPLRVAVLTGVALAQVGEFSFILAERGLALGLVNRDQYQAFLAAAVLTVALTPLLIAAGPQLADFLAALPVPRRWRTGRVAGESPDEKVTARNHVVIVGYGLNGRNLARVLRVVDIDYVVLELNPETVRRARGRGEPVYYGDCTRPAVLEHLGVRAARLLVVAISDPASSRRAVQLARRFNPRLHIIVRTRYLAEVDQLRRLGANAIIPEEFETSVEVFAQVLREYEVPRNLILDLIGQVRGDHYEVLRDVHLSAKKVALPYANILEKLEVESCWVRDGSPARGRTVGELNLRAATGATLVAVRRGGKLLLNPGADLRFEADDTAILIGDRPQVDRALCLLDPTLARDDRPAGP